MALRHIQSGSPLSLFLLDCQQLGIGRSVKSAPEPHAYIRVKNSILNKYTACECVCFAFTIVFYSCFYYRKFQVSL